ncbi:MAG: nuclear transport factor 2 family protein [Acetobacteraceae bacterium]
MSAVLEAKDEIRELMARYCQALDACRFADCAGLFAPDGEWMTDYGSARGRGQIEALLRGVMPVKGEGPQRKHYITNIIITVEGDTAASASDYLIIREAGDTLIPVMGGTYKDRFVRQAGRWWFHRKELVHDIAGDMGLKNGR